MESAKSETSEVDSKTPPTPTFPEKLKILCSSITVEPLIFLFIFPNFVSFIVTQNINLQKACEVNLNYSTSVCHALAARNKSNYNATQEQTVQALVASANGYSSGLQAAFICLTLLIMGSWSDKNRKRKPMLMLPLIGDSVSAVLLMLSLWFYKELPLEFNVFAEAFPQGVAGGVYTFTAAVLAYINEDPDLERRSIKIGFMSILLLIAFYTGTAAGSLLYDIMDHFMIYFVVVVLHLLGMTYTYFRIDEVCNAQKEQTLSKKKRNILLDICRFSHIKKTFQTILRKGSNRGKNVILLLISVWGNYGVFTGT